MTDDRRLARDPIAIVGMSGLLPKARDHREYWQNIVDGVDCTEEVPSSRWSLDDYYDADRSVPDKTYSRRGAFLPDVDFDPLEFGLPPNQLEVTSTMQTLSLGVARDLLVDAGANDSQWYDPARTGVVLGTTGPVPLMHPLAARLSTPVLKEAARSVGLSEGDADAIADRFVAAFAPWEENSFPGLLANVVAGRVANRLGLGGMNCTVDAACAASLAAIRTAIAELQDGRADMMITGGVDTENTIFIYMCFSKVGALSPTDRISPFADGADGTMLGEGISMLALRRLEDARRDGNRIYAVIRGLGSSSDGRSKSIYAPRAEGQRIALDRAYADAECSPADVELIEAHATGTAVGDKTELTALKGLLSDATSETRFAALGSVKSQIGHTKGAAGTASVMKLALALHQKVLPGTINVDAPNAEIDSDAAPFYVNTRTRPWIRDPKRPLRRAAASAMGFGGTNFHLVLEEADSDRDGLRVLHRTPRAHIWHAPDAAGLVAAVRDTEAGDGGGIPEEHARIGFVSLDDETAAELRGLAVDELLRNPGAAHWDHPEGVYFRAAALSDRKAGALFAGQGSQYVDMGLDAALNNPPVGAAFDAANAAFVDAERRLGGVVFPPPAFDDDARAEQEIALRRTEFAQPAIGALSAGQFEVLRDFGFRPEGYLGHSFGELTALWASGAVTTEGFFGLARARGAAMTVPEGVDAGTMVAVGAGRADIEKAIAGIEDVWVCNDNAPDQVVVGGGAEGIAAVTDVCAQKGWVTRHLPVSGAFHTPYVGHAVEAFGQAVAAVEVGAPDARVYADTEGASYGADIESNRATLTAQLSNPVDFHSALTQMRADGCTVFVEFGPKQVLTSLVRRTFGNDVIAIATDPGPIGNGDLALKRAAVRLAVLGFELSELNRYAAPERVARARKPAMTVTISAPEYVPASRRESYAAALSDGYRVVTDAPAAPVMAAPTPIAVPVPQPAPVPVLSNGHSENSENHVTADPQYRLPAPGALDSALVQHLHTHRHYLDGQLELARDLAGALRDGGLDELTVRAIEAVKDHGVAISESHSRAGDVVAQLAELEGGGAPVSRVRTVPSYVEPAAIAPATAPALTGNGAAAHSLAAPAPAPAVAAPADGALAPAASAPAAPRQESVTPAAYSVPVAQAAVVTEPPVEISAGLSGEVLRQALREVVADKTGYPVEMVDPTMDLEADLGVDSIKRVQVIGALQERFPELPVLGPEQLGTLRTLDQIVNELAAGEVSPAVVTEAAPAAEVLPTANGVLDGEVLRQALREVVADKTGYPVEMVDPTMDLEADLGVDSIKRVQVIGALQERFPELPVLGPEQLGTLRTLDQIVGELAGGDVHPKAEAAAQTPRHVVELVELPPVDLAVEPYRPAGTALLVCLDGTAETDCEAIEEQLRVRSWTVLRAQGPAAVAEAGPVDACVVVAGVATEWEQAQRILSDAILTAGRALPRLRAAAERAGFVTVTRLDGHLGFRGDAEPVAALLGGIGGVVKSLAAEQPSLFCRALDIDPAVLPQRLAEHVLEELCDAAVDTPEVGIDGSGVRRTPVPGAHGPALTADIVTAGTEFGPALLTEADVLLVTGGARGVTATCVLELARVTEARFLLLGRTTLDPEPEWARDIADGELKPAAVRALAGTGVTPRDIDRACAQVRAVREIGVTLAQLGDRAVYLAVDATDAAALTEALTPWRGAITGVVHGAGVLADSLIPDKTAESIDRVLRPKLAGLGAVLAAAGDPTHLVLFTSVAGLFGNAGQADYAAANEALGRFAMSWGHRHPDRYVTALDWGAWDGGMVTPALREHFSARGIPLLAPAAGAAAFTAQFTASRRTEPVLLIGAATALSTGAAEPATVRARRDITGLIDEPVIAAHRVGEHIVLPATFGLGAMAQLAERTRPGRIVVGARDLQVLRGVVFDHPVNTLEIELTPAEPVDGRTAVRATVFGDSAARFRATLLLADAPEAAARQQVPDGPGVSAEYIYRDGIQFHAPALQGLRSVRALSDAALVLECELLPVAVASGAYASRLHNPVLADLILQAPPVLGHRLLGAACLPLGVGRIDYHAPLPAGEPFLVVVDNPRATRMEAVLDATALTLDGTVLQRFSDVTVLTTPDLTEKFRTSVRRWTA
ncbi:acyltransferase domain-containing protein [Nocardia sp. NBC_01503]|uniref:beta-ketoacyl synthase N-terminal-like domain-containing protein n=1 Tax=Nocardia sp. NBC_01503 TaxID=2975997 RepID=UPI002E7B08D9|nr:beta-ketoacyl synthase N-terminal-like domain-containing protein [Nocardia sp. NBC_01503]WTL31786.1 acyltransferase domain-containing protein [Nocardia sp. NBC_01503]